jgi:TPP-dependent pyruvate/acetoin dehydrogenase alpha subunit
MTSLSRDQLHEIYRYLVLAREAEERLEILFKQGHVKGGVYRSLGQEGGAVAGAYALRRRDDGTGDILAPTIRATGAVFLMGGRPLDYFRQYLSRTTGPTRGREANVHWCDLKRGIIGPVSPLGSMVEVMAGVTLAFRMRGEDRVGMVFGGDGASSTGAWHEGLNFAAVRRCPLVLMVEANQWAFSTPTRRQTRVESFLDKCEGYGIHGVGVDGNDVLAVLEATRGAVERARSGEGTQMVELRYYRRRGHAQHDPQDYVDPDEIARWERLDPIAAYRRRLLEELGSTPDQLDALDREGRALVREHAEQAVAEDSPDPDEALQGVWTDLGLRPLWVRQDPPDPTTPHVVAGSSGDRVVDPHNQIQEEV